MADRTWYTCCPASEYQGEIRAWLLGKFDRSPDGFSYFHLDSVFDAEDYLNGDLLVTLMGPTRIRFELEDSDFAVEVELNAGKEKSYAAALVRDEGYLVTKHGRSILDVLKQLYLWMLPNADPEGQVRSMFTNAA